MRVKSHSRRTQFYKGCPTPGGSVQGEREYAGLDIFYLSLYKKVVWLMLVPVPWLEAIQICFDV